MDARPLSWHIAKLSTNPRLSADAGSSALSDAAAAVPKAGQGEGEGGRLVSDPSIVGLAPGRYWKPPETRSKAEKRTAQAGRAEAKAKSGSIAAGSVASRGNGRNRGRGEQGPLRKRRVVKGGVSGFGSRDDHHMGRSEPDMPGPL